MPDSKTQPTQPSTEQLDEIERLHERCKMLARSVASLRLLLQDERIPLMRTRINAAYNLSLIDPQGWYARDVEFLLFQIEEISELNDAT